ncbi:MAG: ribose transport system ATP-binding protein [Solirubrobacterales bacterium]|jgi:ABC-type sugar transport system ATPase subunit|nr:ribose transport system ATP-binding protein [Solirubrobacterales bacterium]
MSPAPGAVEGAPRLQMRSVSKRFVGVPALSDVSLEVDEGQILALVGENGAGKSTLIKILSGAVQADEGEILIGGRPTSIGTPGAAERLGIATVYQELNLFPSLSVAENLLFRRYPKRGAFIDWRRSDREAERFLGVIGLELPANRLVSELSIAERQMLEIAKALHRQARILILDEPTAVLGGSDVDRLLEMVRGLRDHGVATIFISHRLDEIFGFADRYLVLKDGAEAGHGPLADVDADRLVSMMVGRELDDLSAPPAVPQPRQELLRVEGLSRRGVLSDISFDLARGEVLGVAGLRGAGRTEMARAIFGADPIDAGDVFVEGERIRVRTPAGAIANGIGLVPEDRGSQGLFRNLSTSENVTVAALAAGKWHLVSPSGERELASRFKQSLNIRVADLGAPVMTLSGGNQQKVVLAKWLEAGVKVLILDEPTRGIDVGSKREIYDVIRGLSGEGVGVILISSELPEVLEMSNRILVMRQGSVVAELSAAEATEEKIMAQAVGSDSTLTGAGVATSFEREYAQNEEGVE